MTEYFLNRKKWREKELKQKQAIIANQTKTSHQDKYKINQLGKCVNYTKNNTCNLEEAALIARGEIKAYKEMAATGQLATAVKCEPGPPPMKQPRMNPHMHYGPYYGP